MLLSTPLNHPMAEFFVDLSLTYCINMLLLLIYLFAPLRVVSPHPPPPPPSPLPFLEPLLAVKKLDERFWESRGPIVHGANFTGYITKP